MEHDFHAELKGTVRQFLLSNNYTVAAEVPLPNNKIADIAAMDRNGKVLIVEVKTTLHNYLMQEAHLKYGAYCDALYVASEAGEILTANASPILTSWPDIVQKIGLLGVQRRIVQIVRQSEPRSLDVDRRAAVQRCIADSRPCW